MPEIQCKGSIILATVAYTDELCAKEGRPRIRDALSPSLSAALPTMQRVAWRPITEWVEVLRAIVAVCDNDEARAYDALVQCGRAICEDAAGSFMKLLLRMMPPALFCRKFPDFWRRDFTGGTFVVDTSRLAENRFQAILRDIEAFDHVGPVAVGFIGFAQEKVTGKSVSVQRTGWSLERPGPPEVVLELSW